MGKLSRKLKRKAGLKPAKAELQVYELDASATVEELEEAVRQLGPSVLESGNPFYVSVRGFDQDPRELWEIPEVSELCKRMIESGFFGLMGDNEELGTQGFMDARMCHALARGTMQSDTAGHGVVHRSSEIARDMLETFEAANKKVDALLAETPADNP